MFQTTNQAIMLSLYCFFTGWFMGLVHGLWQSALHKLKYNPRTHHQSTIIYHLHQLSSHIFLLTIPLKIQAFNRRFLLVVSWNRGTPSHHPWFRWIFHGKPWDFPLDEPQTPCWPSRRNRPWSAHRSRRPAPIGPQRLPAPAPPPMAFHGNHGETQWFSRSKWLKSIDWGQTFEIVETHGSEWSEFSAMIQSAPIDMFVALYYPPLTSIDFRDAYHNS